MADSRTEGGSASSAPHASGRTSRFVIPAGSEELLLRLLNPLLFAPPLPVRGISVESTVVVLTLDAGETEATVVLHHSEQHSRSTSASVELREAGLKADIACPACSREVMESLREAVYSLNDHDWRSLWLRPEQAPRDPAAVTGRNRPLRSLVLANIAPVLAALFALALVMLRAWRSGSPVLPVQIGPGVGRAPDESLGGRPRWYDLALIGVLLIVVAWPVYQSPLVDAGLGRLFDLVNWPFACPGHPAPPYFFVRPFAAVSLEAWVVRLPFLALVLSLTLLTTSVAGWAGGRWAGLLAGLWMVFEVRRRHGLFDMTFWDLAALFALALLIWLLVVERLKRDPGPLMWLALVLIMIGGLYSSWLFVVPAGVAVFSVGLLALQGRVRWTGFGAAAVVLGLMAVRVLIAFVRVGDTPIPSQTRVVADLLLHTPVGRSAWMLVPLAAGTWWLALRLRRPFDLSASSVYALLSAPAVILALFIMGGVRYVTGGYYLQLVSGAMLYVAAVGAAAVIGSVGGFFASPWRRRAAGFSIMLVLAVSTHGIPYGALLEDVDGVEHIAKFDRLTRSGDQPIFTNERTLDLLIGYARGRKGEPWDQEVLAEVFTRFLPLEPVDCVLDERQFEARFDREHVRALALRSQAASPRHFVVLAKSQRVDMTECLARLTEGCRRLFEESRVYDYFSCDTDVLGILTALLPPVAPPVKGMREVGTSAAPERTEEQ